MTKTTKSSYHTCHICTQEHPVDEFVLDPRAALGDWKYRLKCICAKCAAHLDKSEPPSQRKRQMSDQTAFNERIIENCTKQAEMLNKMATIITEINDEVSRITSALSDLQKRVPDYEVSEMDDLTEQRIYNKLIKDPDSPFHQLLDHPSTKDD